MVPLRDRYDAAEGDLISMICEVNKPGVPAMWLKDGEQITVADGYEIVMDGCRHILRIPSCELEDDAEYTVMVGDLESITNLFVEGRESKSSPQSQNLLPHTSYHKQENKNNDLNITLQKFDQVPNLSLLYMQ